MIGRLQGILLVKQPPSLMLDVQGVGYEIDAPMSTFYQLPEAGQQITLLTHMVVREDAQLLYGFASESERRFFRGLLKVNGVGAKLAITILSGIAAQEFAQTVKNNDVIALTRLPGIGKKTAERLIIEMRDRLQDWHDGELNASTTTDQSAGSQNVEREAVSALIALGYKPQQASRMVAAVDSVGLDNEQLIRVALQSSVK